MWNYKRWNGLEDLAVRSSALPYSRVGKEDLVFHQSLGLKPPNRGIGQCREAKSVSDGAGVLAGHDKWADGQVKSLHKICTDQCIVESATSFDQ